MSLLRSSRRAEELTKHAILGRALLGLGRAGGKLGLKGLGAMGGLIRRHPIGTIGGALIAGSTGAAVHEGMKRSELGMSPEWRRAQSAGRVGYLPPSQV